MKTINRMMTNILSENLQESKDFYTTLFDLEVEFDSDWFVHLHSRDKQLELGIVKADHTIVPQSIQVKNGGHYITFVVDITDEVFEMAISKGYNILQIPENTFYGQRRLLLQDPNGTVVDVSSPIPDIEL